jgi:hypothetical protein
MFLSLLFFIVVFNFVLISFFSLIFVCCNFLVSLQFDSCTMRISTLRKRTFVQHWAIVCRSPLNSAKDTEEANVRLALGDRSLPRQAPMDEHSSPTTHAY